MSLDFILPDIGEGIAECEVVQWRIKEGDMIEEDQPVADVSTDKALVEITSMYTGRVNKLYYQQGDIAKVHTPLFAIDVDGQNDQRPVTQETPGEQTHEHIAQASHHQQTGAHTQGDDHRQTGGHQQETIECTGGHTQNSMAHPGSYAADQMHRTGTGKVLATPAVRRLARENNFDLSQVPATGKNGRVLKEDVLNFLNPMTGNTVAAAADTASPAIASAANTTSGAQLAATSPHLVQSTDTATGLATAGSLTADRIEPIKGIRAIMAKTMMDSASTIPHFTYVDEVDMTALVALRTMLKEQYAMQGLRLTLMPFLMKALSLALQQHPIVNSQANAAFTELHYKADHNIGMAVDSPAGLLVPNVKKVQTLSMVALAQQITRLTEAARAGRIAPDELKGGTITISNVGAIGGVAATPIINKPEVAIVALGKIQSLPRFDADGAVQARQIMTVSWSGDHRVIDGATLARFNNTWKNLLENPSSMLMMMT